jgi:hypothetical protein
MFYIPGVPTKETNTRTPMMLQEMVSWKFQVTSVTEKLSSFNNHYTSQSSKPMVEERIHWQYNWQIGKLAKTVPT